MLETERKEWGMNRDLKSLPSRTLTDVQIKVPEEMREKKEQTIFEEIMAKNSKLDDKLNPQNG